MIKAVGSRRLMLLLAYFNKQKLRFILREGIRMATITKKELIDRISEGSQAKRVLVKRVIQSFLDEIIAELAQENRLEFRDFGIFETRTRASRMAQNPKTLERVEVPPKRSVKFKMGRLMKSKLCPEQPITE